jgi:hypothetical protein
MTSKAQKKRERWAKMLDESFGPKTESAARLREQNRRVDKRKRAQYLTTGGE